MPSTSGSNRTYHNNDVSSSYFQKTVCLYDWWLIEAEEDFEGKRLAVAGLTSREQRAVRVFSSAPIIKRYDVFTLETADRICVVIRGFMNKLRTNQNGFPSEVFRHFLFGFPPDWERYAVELLGGDSTSYVSDSLADSDESATDSGSKENPSPISMNCFSHEQTPNNYEQAIYKDKHDIEASKGCSHDLKNKVGEGESDAGKESTLKKKTKRKLFLDTHVSSCTREPKKVSIVSPESLSFGRSRSGRLLIPTMEFWRNQLPIYDVDRQLTGIQEDLPAVKSRGSISEKRRKQ